MMKKIIIGIICVFANIATFAQQRVEITDITNIRTFSEELVSTASKVEESINDAPGVITIINATDIERFGANNLRELLDRVVNVLNLGSHLYPQNISSIRGDLLSHIDNRVLILLNGRPIREGLTGGVNSTIYLAFPIQTLQRIEVVRGPGSVLYGTNAYMGVINLITKMPKNVEFQSQVGAGDFETMQYNATTGGRIGGWNFISGIHFLKSDGWNFIAKDEANADVQTRFGESNMGGVLSINRKGKDNNISFNSFIGFSDQDNLGVAPIIASAAGPTQRNMNVLRGLVDLGYEKQIMGDKWQANLNVNYNYLKQYAGVLSDPYEALASDMLIELTNYVRPIKNMNIIVGGTAYFHSGRANQNAIEAVAPYNEIWYSAYTQLDYRIVSRLKIIAGGQLNKTPRSDFDFVPRIGAIFDIIKNLDAKRNLSLKILYGEAFRASFSAENFIKISTLVGNPNLAPEKVATIDAQLFFNTRNLQVSGGFFYSVQRNIITRVPTAVAGVTGYENKGEIVFQGFETEFRINAGRAFYVTGSASFTESVQNDTLRNATHVPQLMAKLGLHYNLAIKGKEYLSIGLFNSYIGEASDVSVVNATRREYNPAAQAYNFMTLKLSLNLMRLLDKNAGTNQFLINLYATNLLDEAIFYPEFNRRRINTLPGRAGRAFYGSITFKF